MKTRAFLLLAVAAAAGTCGCSTFRNEPAAAPQVKVDVIPQEDIVQSTSEGRSIGDKLLKALSGNDYDSIAALPIGDGSSNNFTRERFDALYQKVQSQGGVESFKYLGDLNMRPYHRLLWKVSFKDLPDKPGNGVDVLFEVIIVKLNGTIRVAGFAFRQ